MIERLYKPIARLLGSESIWSREWDVLCVLDGCRVDTFREVWGGDDVESVRSVASMSKTWLQRTFENRDTSRFGYISANPFATMAGASSFAYFHLEPVARVGGVETVDPSVLTDRAISVWRRREEFGVGQLIVHYMQPHIPFRSRPEWFEGHLGAETWGSELWSGVGSTFDRGEWFDAYRDNLAWVLDDGIDPLRVNCDAEIAITADHGNAAGEWGVYGHPRSCPVPAVRRVPWVTIDGRDHETRSPRLESPNARIDVGRQLEALGYVNKGK